MKLPSKVAFAFPDIFLSWKYISIPLFVCMLAQMLLALLTACSILREVCFHFFCTCDCWGFATHTGWAAEDRELFTAHAATSDGQTRDSLPVLSDRRSVHSGWFLLGLQKMLMCEYVKFWNHLLSVDNSYIRYTASRI